MFESGFRCSCRPNDLLKVACVTLLIVDLMTSGKLVSVLLSPPGRFKYDVADERQPFPSVFDSCACLSPVEVCHVSRTAVRIGCVFI